VLRRTTKAQNSCIYTKKGKKARGKKYIKFVFLYLKCIEIGCFSAYLINTNDPVKLNKLKLLKDIVVKWKLDVLNLMEIHDQNPSALGPLQGWHKTSSTPVGGKHCTAPLSATSQGKLVPEFIKCNNNSKLYKATATRRTNGI
jgi:hypothetical protein